IPAVEGSNGRGPEWFAEGGGRPGRGLGGAARTAPPARGPNAPAEGPETRERPAPGTRDGALTWPSRGRRGRTRPRFGSAAEAAAHDRLALLGDDDLRLHEDEQLLLVEELPLPGEERREPGD